MLFSRLSLLLCRILSIRVNRLCFFFHSSSPVLGPDVFTPVYLIIVDVHFIIFRNFTHKTFELYWDIINNLLDRVPPWPEI